ncbi:hypothetical protein GGH94_000157 [Coemansia aciculifera]|uniref:F-box domain-containing protein n=1 Tax=Coemansia aciculifera TaxID=417176 RepID=A0A9W8M8T2_9FUNG|nr:hypothetical protein GGH94_000157 [Coemansia aciculifera]KAJ2875872.1 hypothetical protein GGH93_001206 [Coemansia aciculifera]
MTLKPTPATCVISNSLILDEILPHLEQHDLAQLCLVQKQTWQLVVSRLWEKPLLHTIDQFERFASSIGAALPFELRNHQCYGDLICELDFSMVARRWDKLGYDLLAPVFKHCSRVKDVDLSLCRILLGVQFEHLFTDNPRLCASLTSVDISETLFPASNIVSVLNILPGITTLVLNETETDDSVLEVVSKSLSSLEWLEIDRCELITDVGIKAVADGCPKLAYLSIRECWGILNTDLVEKINARGGWEDLTGSQVYEDSDYSDSDEYEDYDSDFFDF